MKYAISGARIFDGIRMLDQHSVIVEGARICQLVADADLDPSLSRVELKGGTLAPGFIDLQVNGGGGLLFNNAPEPDTVVQILNAHRSMGVTALLPTLVSDSREKLQAGIDAVKNLLSTATEGILGIHIEGPFFNPARRGVHDPDCIRPLNQDDQRWLCNNSDIPMMVTLAPEQTQAGQIKSLSDAGIIVCAGHTDALAEDIEQALAEGLKGFTHLFNAMRPMASREPGVVGSALADRNSWCGIIVDNHHVHPSTVLVAHRAKAAGKLYLVSDAMATIGSEDKSFKLYNETITEEDGRLLNSEGKLAGSAIGMIDAVRISHQSVGLPLEECLKMASLYPAQFMQLDDQRGSIQQGYRADLVHFNDDFHVCNTWLAGSQQQYCEDES